MSPVNSLIVVINRVALALSVVRFRFNFFISASDILIYYSVLECTIPRTFLGGEVTWSSVGGSKTWSRLEGRKSEMSSDARYLVVCRDRPLYTRMCYRPHCIRSAQWRLCLFPLRTVMRARILRVYVPHTKLYKQSTSQFRVRWHFLPWFRHQNL